MRGDASTSGLPLDSIDAGTTERPSAGIARCQDVTRTLPHIPVQLVPISVEWNVHRNRNVPAARNRFFTVTPTGSVLL